MRITAIARHRQVIPAMRTILAVRFLFLNLFEGRMITGSKFLGVFPRKQLEVAFTVMFLLAYLSAAYV